MALQTVHLILYVQNQAESTAFYTTVLAHEPRLDAPGMTEFELPGGAVLGLMPVSGISRILGHAVEGLASPPRVPRAELYLLVDSPEVYLSRAVQAGARKLSGLKRRDWGHVAGYCEDPDGHVVAFAAEERSA